MIRNYMKNGIACLKECQILDLRRAGQEIFVLRNDYIIPGSLGKNAKNAIALMPAREKLLINNTQNRSGNYYYWYTQPLHNYYHCLLDGVGQLSHYFELKKQYKDLKLLVNQSPKPAGRVIKHPPYIAEMLELFDIEWEYTDETTMYETVFYGDTIGQMPNGKRRRPDDLQYKILQYLIKTAKKRSTAPIYEKIYLSRRAHANTLKNRKDVIGEDNTVKRGLTNEDEVVDILSKLGYVEVFGENYSLAEKIIMFNNMKKYISTAGAGVANILWTMPNTVSVGGIHTPGFPFPSDGHTSHICTNKKFINATINLYHGKVKFVDPLAGAKNYNSPWYINNLKAFSEWAATI